MKYGQILSGLVAAFGLGLAGCDNTDDGAVTPTVDRELESVERVEPEADVEVMPSGEVDVQLDPEVTP